MMSPIDEPDLNEIEEWAERYAQEPKFREPGAYAAIAGASTACIIAFFCDIARIDYDTVWLSALVVDGFAALAGYGYGRHVNQRWNRAMQRAESDLKMRAILTREDE